jgi:hypothetical protein
MAALAIAAGCIWGNARALAADTAVENKVSLQLQINGLSTESCTIVIKPGHPGCQFETVEKKLSKTGQSEVLNVPAFTIKAKSTGADRDCSFAITIKEPGQPPRTVRRGLRLAAPKAGQPTPMQTLKLHLSAPSIAARESDARTRR